MYLTIQPKLGVSGTSTNFFSFCHLIAWPWGIALTLLTSGVGLFDLCAHDNYLAGRGCYGNFSFVLSPNEADCLMSRPGLSVWMAYYAIEIALLILVVFLYAITLWVTHKTWKQTANKLVYHTNVKCVNKELYDGDSIAASCSLTVYKTILRLSTTAFIYVVSMMPIIAAKVYRTRFGPIPDQTIREWSNALDDLMRGVIGISNIIFYAYFSPIFRSEIKQLVTCTIYCCTRKTIFKRNQAIAQSHCSSEVEMNVRQVTFTRTANQEL